MNHEERALARILFHSKVLKANGQAYEDLFVEIMQKGNSNFISVKPQGAIGDRKNDGYDRKKGCYYQVFAPEDPKAKSQDAVTKLVKDFAGLYAYWNTITPVKEFFFVFNDKFEGSFPTIEKNLATIKTSHSLDDCGSFLAKDLEDRLFALHDDEVVAIVGFIPNPDKIETLDYSVLAQIIAHVLKQKSNLEPSKLLSAPDFSEKIKFNGLGLQTSALLTTASYQVGILDKYFELNSDFTKQELRDTINDLYKSALTKDFSSDRSGVNKNDLVFLDILNSIAPSGTQATINAALVVMGYFFESCDIFEDPNSSSVQ
jgi:hypothetical protein